MGCPHIIYHESKSDNYKVIQSQISIGMTFKVIIIKVNKLIIYNSLQLSLQYKTISYNIFSHISFGQFLQMKRFP